jgi:DUF1680 family protein
MNTETPAGKPLALALDTKYPYDGAIRIALSLAAEEQFDLTLRIPAWCENATVAVNGSAEAVERGYLTLSREWRDGDVVELSLSMPITRVLPPKGAANEDLFAAYRRGPIVLAADKRVTDPDAVLDVACDKNGYVAETFAHCPEIPEHKLCREVALSSGEKIRLIDYASAGKTWTEESRMGAWLRRK